jgi:uncharacterized protein YcnI
MLAAAALVIGGWSASASAHVTITTFGVVTQGSYSKIGFSVPTERDDAGTVKLKVQMPKDQAIASVSVLPMPGWTIETTTRALNPPVTDDDGRSISEVVDTITWTATGDTQIAPGQFQLFWVSLGQLPTDVTSISFPAIQTYSDGQEVAWIDQPAAGGAEPEHPAPTLQLAAASGGESADAGSGDSGSDDGGSDTLAVVAIVIGGLGLIAGGSAMAMTRRTGARPST